MGGDKGRSGEIFLGEESPGFHESAHLVIRGSSHGMESATETKPPGEFYLKRSG